MKGSPAPLRILIVDDEEPARERTRRLLNKIENIEIVGEASNGEQAISLVESLQPDVILLDIQMPGLNGMRVLDALDDPPAVIFSTAHDKFAVQAFEKEAVDYLLKPYSADRVAHAIERARRLLSGAKVPTDSSKPIRISAQNGLTTEIVPSEIIVFATILEGVVFIYRDDGESLIYEGTLNDLEELLPPGLFFRISRQAIINLDYIESYTPAGDGGLRVKLRGGHVVMASRRRARHLRARLS